MLENGTVLRRCHYDFTLTDTGLALTEMLLKKHVA